MSKYELRRTIKKELKDLNWKIDMRIVRGLPYRTEARRHKFLLMQLNRLSEKVPGGVFGRMAGALASFVL